MIERMIRAGAGPRWLLGVFALLIVAPGETCAHGERAVPMRVSLFTGESYQVELSFDAALAGDPEDGVAEAGTVDREWLVRRTPAELAALEAATRDRLQTWFHFTLAGEALEGEILFPDLEVPDPDFDNGEPEGHLIVFWSGLLPREGGSFAIGLGDDAPAAIITTVVDDNPLRRPAVLLGGERKILYEVEPVAAPVPGSDAGPDAAPWADPDAGGPLPLLGGAFDDPPPREPSLAEAYLRLGWRHVVPDGFDHLLLAGALFLGARSWRGTFLQPLALAAGAALGTLWALGWGMGTPPDLLVFGVVALAVQSFWIGEVRWWRLVFLAAIGFAHGAAFASKLPSDSSHLAAALSFNLGVDAAQLAAVFAAFVVLGWAHGTAYWHRWIARPGAALVAVGAVIAGLA
ncbi:hypothetical protein BH23VER1_BH23VER1_34390 [soil metagenome]